MDVGDLGEEAQDVEGQLEATFDLNERVLWKFLFEGKKAWKGCTCGFLSEIRSLARNPVNIGS